MSLLLEALKKAEKAKEEAQRRAREDRPSGEPEELRGEEAPPEAAAEPAAEVSAQAAPALMTRDNLPEISQRLEILTDDLLDKPAARRRARYSKPSTASPTRACPSTSPWAASARSRSVR